jgi:tRNA threonylcarbamoyladenosine biosynthesis protein TsaE
MSTERPPQDASAKEPVRIADTRSITHSAEETFQLGVWIGEALKGPAIFLLRGELGAGKTVFAKGIAAGLGIHPADVTSPSFTLINVHEGRLRFYHVDLYRLDPSSTMGLGLDEMFEEPDAVVAIEWAERLGHPPAGAIAVELKCVSEDGREIRIKAE